MNGSIGTARLNLTVDTSEFEARISSSRNLTHGLSSDAQAAFQQVTGGAKRATESLLRYTQSLGQGVEEQKLLNAAIKGVPIAIIEEARQAILRERDAIAAAEAQQKALNAARQQGAAAAADVMKQFNERQAFIKGLEQQTAAINKSRAELLEMKAAQLGVSSAAAPFIAQLKAQEAAIQQGNRAFQQQTRQLNEYGLSQKQVTAAMRGVPAQITDIFISLQGGQNPLTVLLQQGGQLKDMFGGIVPAARALASSFMGLVNPTTISAAAIGTLFVAFLKAEQRMDAFNRALILSGNSGAFTAEQLNNLALSLDNINGITANQAADALTQIAASGKIAASQYELIAEAASRMEDVAGVAIKTTVAEYAEIARDPVNAILKLNESENFLTASLLERVRTLQEAGRIEEAAAVASEARAEAQIARAKEVVENLGLISGAWFQIKQSTGEAWDEAVNYFGNLDREAKAAASTLRSVWDALKLGGPATGFALQNALSGAGGATGRPAAPQAPKINTEAERQLQAIAAGNRTREEAQKLEIERIRNLGKAAGRTTQDIEKLVEASNKAYEAAKPKGRKGGAAALANAERTAALQAIKDQLTQEQSAIENQTRRLQAEYSARLVSTTDYYTQLRALQGRGVEAEASALQKQIAYLKARDLQGKDSVNVARQIGEMEARLAKVRADGATQLAILAIQEKDVADKRARAMASYRDALDRENQASKLGFDAAVARITMGEREAEIQQKLSEVYQSAADKQRELAQQFGEDRDREKYEQNLAAVQDYVNRQVEIIRDGYARMDAAQSDWLNGVRTGVQDWITKAGDVASQTSRITQSVMDDATAAIQDFATEGKANFKGLLSDVLKEISRFLIKKAVLQFAQVLSGAFGNAGGGIGAGGMANTNPGSLTGFAKGGMFVNPHPSLSSLSGQVISQPTPFYFAKGAALGVGGEAGPEGILPLQRGADGRLGVIAMGGSGVTVYINTTINSDGSASTETQTSGEQASAAKEFADRMRLVARDEIGRQSRPGGILYGMGVRSNG